MQLEKLRRRYVITAAGAAVAWPRAARAQQPAMPVIGFLDPTSPDAATADRLPCLPRRPPSAAGSEGENAAIEYRWADSRIDRLSVLAAEGVLLAAALAQGVGGVPAQFAAKAETSTIPI